MLWLTFLKCIFEAFEEHHAEISAEWDVGMAEDRDDYTAESIFWVPPEARWGHLQAQPRRSDIGRIGGDSMAVIECDNPSLESVLP